MGTITEYLERSAEKFADAEAKILDAARAVKELVPLMKEGNELLEEHHSAEMDALEEKHGRAPGGFLQSSAMGDELAAIYGVLRGERSRLLRLHGEGVDIMSAYGEELPQNRDGGGHR